MLTLLRTVAWIACVIYSTIPAFWLLIHPRAEFWRSRRRSPYRILLPVWIAMWAARGRDHSPLARPDCSMKSAGRGFRPPLYSARALCSTNSLSNDFSLSQLGGLPEILRDHSQQHLVTTGIRARVRHPVYLGHLCEMLAWSVGTGLAVCWALTAFAIVTGAVMIQLEDEELEKRFGDEYRQYRSRVPAVLPRIRI